ncbi:alpha/beta hydrolase [Oricola thermophila]|uniref:Alpha/beta hydrolase n=2 Tax=Oricola thermophila TaxID=2742145 RepID=A0A6N1VMR0_9HYPH|nr:alpha/beta hydrolase [Oricola thermophila]
MQFTISASVTGRRYRIHVALPRDEPARPEGYPVIYMLDGNATFLTGAEALRLQTRKPKGFEPAVLVAIGYETDQPFAVTERYYDYTTPAPLENLPKRKNGEPWPERGGADAFLDFIEDDLKPEIARRLPVDPDRETLAGHSLGGFLTLYAFLTRPDSFATYVAGSPSIWWNGQELLDSAARFVKSSPDLAGKRLFIGIGANEWEDMVADAKTMADRLSVLEDRGLTVRYQQFAGEEHITVLPALISRAVSFSLIPDVDDKWFGRY